MMIRHASYGWGNFWLRMALGLLQLVAVELLLTYGPNSKGSNLIALLLFVGGLGTLVRAFDKRDM